MGNCQAIDTATLVIQHPCGKSDKLYWPVSAAEVIKSNPGHCVALLISSALCPSSNAGAAPDQVRVTRIKLLRPTDTLVLGQVYRLIAAKEVMKVLSAKKHAKMTRQGHEISVEQLQLQPQQQQQRQHETKTPRRHNLPNVRKKDNLADKHERQRQQHKPTTTTTSSSTTGTTNSSAIGRSKLWHPSLKSISEAV